MKKCSRCFDIKSEELFFKNKKSKDGLFVYCKKCCNERQNKYRSLNKEKRNKLSLDSYYRNKEGIRKKLNAKYISCYNRVKTKESVAKSKRKWKDKNMHLVRASASLRRAIMLNACPKWAGLNKIKEIYKEARKRRDLGENVHVDHIIPLVSKFVCGLHVHNNLQIISATENFKKGNKVILDTITI